LCFSPHKALLNSRFSVFDRSNQVQVNGTPQNLHPLALGSSKYEVEGIQKQPSGERKAATAAKDSNETLNAG
jgi:hypothetical protein